MCPQEKLATEFINAGGDMVLFALERDFDFILEAAKKGEISIERIKDAVRHILEMKDRARLFEDQEELVKGIEHTGNMEELSQEIADKSITIVRNSQGVIPLSLKGPSRFLIINM